MIKIPERFGINITKICPLKCNFCFNTPDFLSKGYHYNIEQLKKEIDYLCNYDNIKIIDLTPLVGEPFAHPDIIQIIQYILNKKRKVYIISSLSVQLSQNIINLLKHKDIILFCSLYGDTYNEFNKNTNTSHFNIMLKNLKLIYINRINITLIQRFFGEINNKFIKLFKIETKEIHNRKNNLELNNRETFKNCYFLTEPILNNGYIYKCCYNYNENSEYNDRLSIDNDLLYIYQEFNQNFNNYNIICKSCLWYKDKL